MYKWYLPTLSEIVAVTEPDQLRPFRFPAQQRVRAEQEWSGAVSALNQLLSQTLAAERAVSANCPTDTATKGLLLSGPFPVLHPLNLADRISTWLFTIAAPGEVMQLLPAASPDSASRCTAVPSVPLLPNDPLAAEQFCLALTPEFSLIMVMGETMEGEPAFLFSFEPEVVEQAWRSLEARIKLSAPHHSTALARQVAQFPPISPDYRTVTQFSRLMLANLPQSLELEGKRASYPQNRVPQSRVFEEAGRSLVAVPVSPSPTGQAAPSKQEWHQKPRKAASSVWATQAHPAPSLDYSEENTDGNTATKSSSDTELLQAIAHEVRTPLTTIRTLTRLLLRRKDLNPDVMKRLEVIDRECTEQIDRFNLIFRAVELETTQSKNLLASLTAISLDQVIQQNLARWQQQASQHSHTLDIVLPQKMPLIVTDPTMLDQALTGLIDRITHSLPPGSQIQIKVSLAGHQLKLQLESRPQGNAAPPDQPSQFGFAPALKSIGQLLMFQPETGNLSLNMAVTKNLFQALGGKLIVRQHPQQGEVLTIFLPLDLK